MLLAFVLEAERRGLLPVQASPYRELSLTAQGSDDPARLAALQALLVAGDPRIGLPSFATTRLASTPFRPMEAAELETLLGRSRNWDLHAIGLLHERQLEGQQRRKAQGSFFTPNELAKDLAERALAELPTALPAIVDPTMGCGAFLVEAFRTLAARHPHVDRRTLALRCLHGVDRDATAVELALLGLWLEIGDPQLEPSELGRNLRHGNCLFPGPSPWGESGIDWREAFPEVMARGGFDAVLGNPPFVNIERLNEAERRFYRSVLQGMHKRFDLYVGIIEQALRLLRPQGLLAFILPRSFLSQDYAMPLRQKLLKTMRLLELRENPPFPGVMIPTLSFMAQNQSPEATHGVRMRNDTVPQSLFSRMPNVLIRLDRSAHELEAGLQELAGGIPLGDVAIATWGVRGVPVSQFHRDAAESPEDRPMLKGDCLLHGELEWKGKYLRYQRDALYRPLFPELFERPKIVIAKVTGTRGLQVALDERGFYTDDSLICVQPKFQLADLAPEVLRRHRLGMAAEAIEQSRQYPLPVLLDYLKSPAAQRLFELLLSNGLNVYPEAIKQLPLPRKSQQPTGR